MNSPASSTPRGRGRGRQKEMSSSERVTHWVNQREARRLNKERWANRGSEGDSSAGNEGHENDAQTLVRQEQGQEFGSDRSKGKRQGVQLYVPPSLRLKKESEAVKESSDLSIENDAGRRLENEDICQKSHTTCSTGRSRQRANKSECEGQQQTFCETSRPKGRGQGRRKKEVEIYVPRALRTAKHDSTSTATHDSTSTAKHNSTSTARTHAAGRYKSSCIDTQEISEFVDCDSSASANILAFQSSHQSPVHSESHQQKLYQSSKNEPNVPHVSDSQSSLNPDSSTKKIKYELTDTSLLSTAADSSSCSANDALSEEESSADNSLTFEFYDPAVIAFLPSSQYVEKSCTTNTYFVENSGQSLAASQGSSSLQEDVTKCLVPLVNTNFQQGNDEYQSQSPVKHYVEYNCPSMYEETEEESSHFPSMYEETKEESSNCPSMYEETKEESSNFPSMYEETEEESSHGNITHDSGLNQNDKHLKNEKMSAIDSYESKNSEEIEQTKVLDEYLKPVATVPNILVSEGRTDVDLSEDLKDIVCNNSAIMQEPIEELSQKDISSTEQLAIQTSEEQLVPAGQTCSQFPSSEMNKIVMAHSDKASHDLAEDEDDTWDSLFDDNGDCLDNTLMKELTEYVGKVKIDKPKINYLIYEPKEPEMDFHAFSHILEIYDFSPELATCDLITAFREFSSRGFDVKWVDDTHALGIFSSAIAANEALKMIHPLLKVRAMSEASKKGQAKARHCQEFLQPYKPRPETTSIAARRLVAGALGMSPQVSKEIREQERQKLKEAKEKRRQERQQKVDVWDGSYGKCAMDEQNPGLR